MKLASCLSTELDRRIGMTASTLAHHRIRGKNPRLTIKLSVYNVCVLYTLIYGSKSWTIYVAQERMRLLKNVFHMRSMKKLLGISWTSRTPKTDVVSRCGLSIMFTMLRQRWRRHVQRMKRGRITKDILYGKLIADKHNFGSGIGRLQLRYRVTCKRNMKELKTHLN